MTHPITQKHLFKFIWSNVEGLKRNKDIIIEVIMGTAGIFVEPNDTPTFIGRNMRTRRPNTDIDGRSRQMRNETYWRQFFKVTVYLPNARLSIEANICHSNLYLRTIRSPTHCKSTEAVILIATYQNKKNMATSTYKAKQKTL